MSNAPRAVLAFVLTQDSFRGSMAYVIIGCVAGKALVTLFFLSTLQALWFALNDRAGIYVRQLTTTER